MLFSATMPPEIRKLSDHFLTDPVHVETRSIWPKHIILPSMCGSFGKTETKLLIDMLDQKAVRSCVIFVRTKRRADMLAANLSEQA